MKKLLSYINHLLISTIVSFLAYYFDLFGLASQLNYEIWPWVILTLIGSISTWLYNTNAVEIAGWILGRPDELNQT